MSFRTAYGNDTSENGWRMVNSDSCPPALVPGTDTKLRIREGDAATILIAWACWYHNNVEPIDRFRDAPTYTDDWGWSEYNDVGDSNHLSGTAIDINATQYPWGARVMPDEMVAKVQEGLRLFEGTVFWGADWSRADEMHYQIGLPEDDPALGTFAARLNQGYLGIYAPPDPNAFPLPGDLYYGPLDGDERSVSGLFASDREAWRDGLRRWQKALGIEETGIWERGSATQIAAKQIQIEKGWDPSLDGIIGTREWDVVINQGYRPNQNTVVPEVAFTEYCDISQWQNLVDDSYPYEYITIRACTGDREDEHFRENYARATDMIERGKLRGFSVYLFWRGPQTWDKAKQLITEVGGPHPKMSLMFDVEGAGGEVTGDQSDEVNAAISAAQEWLGSPHGKSRVYGYYNILADPDLWASRPPGLKFVVPDYSANPPRTVIDGFIIHQRTQEGDVAPFGHPVDVNEADLSITELLQELGAADETPDTSVIDPPPEVRDRARPVDNGKFGVDNIRDFGPITGPGVTSRLGFESTDLGVMCQVGGPSGEIIAVFGDTFRGKGVGQGEWMSPVAAFFSAGDDPNNGINFTRAVGQGQDGSGAARQLWPYEHNNPEFSTVIPSDIIEVNGRLYLHAQVHRGLGEVQWTEIQASADHGETWQHTGVKWPGDLHGGMFQVATWAAGGDGYLYVMSTCFKRNKPIIMHRVKEDRIADAGAYEPWGWNPVEGWRWGLPPSPVMEGQFGELCLRRIQNNFVLLLFNAAPPPGGYRVEALVFGKPWDNLYEAHRVTLLFGSGWNNEGPGHMAQPYGPYIVPGSTLDNFHFVASQWNTGIGGGWPYQVKHFETRIPFKVPPDLPASGFGIPAPAPANPRPIPVPLPTAIAGVGTEHLDGMIQETMSKIEEALQNFANIFKGR